MSEGGRLRVRARDEEPKLIEDRPRVMEMKWNGGDIYGGSGQRERKRERRRFGRRGWGAG